MTGPGSATGMAPHQLNELKFSMSDMANRTDSLPSSAGRPGTNIGNAIYHDERRGAFPLQTNMARRKGIPQCLKSDGFVKSHPSCHSRKAGHVVKLFQRYL